jgi:hypothetical protein
LKRELKETEPLYWKGFWVGHVDVVVSSYFTWWTWL